MLETVLVLPTNLWVLAEELQKVFQQIIVIDYLLVELGFHVSLVELIDLRCHTVEKRVTIVSFFARRPAGVASVTDQIGDDFGLWVVLGFDELAIGRLNDVF